jgi:(p)ppGpp synthase/HD superfamily hydrolase
MHHPTIEDTIRLVRPHFEPHLDYGGDSFFHHLQRVAEGVAPYGETFVHAAWMHDLIEDTNMTLKDLGELGYHLDIITAVDLLTRPKKVSYAEYIDRLIASQNPIALVVKISDQIDNTNPRRFAALPHFVARALERRYAGLLPRLLSAATALEIPVL